MSGPARARWVAVVNPAAGRGAGRKLAPALARLFDAAGVRLDVMMSPGPDEGARLARQAVEDGYECVVAVGGDGTANECANGLIGTGAALALYPIGTGNDFARNLGYPRRTRDVPRFLSQAARRTIDVGEANGRVFVNHVGIGIDGVVAERARSLARTIGPALGYAASSLAALATYRPTEMHVTLDGDEREGRFLVIVCSNGVHFGGGMKAAPTAQMDDGWLDVTLAGDLGVRDSVLALLRLYRGTHVDGERVHARRARAVEIRLKHPLPMELDGEVSRVDSLSVRARPASLEVLAA